MPPLRLFDFLLEQDIVAAETARESIAKAIEPQEVFPSSCRCHAHNNPKAMDKICQNWRVLEGLRE